VFPCLCTPLHQASTTSSSAAFFSLQRTPRPISLSPEHRCHRVVAVAAACCCGRVATGRLTPSWVAKRVRVGTLRLLHHSFTADAAPTDLPSEIPDDFLCKSWQGPCLWIRLKPRA
jgi:hypothetical protein